jgi:hypothetical protein
MLALCKFLNTKKAFRLLYDIQLFMKDYVRAGVTCINLYVQASDIPTKIRFLETSKVE